MINKLEKMRKATDVLFILKKRMAYGEQYSSTLSSGLLNSASFVNKMLLDSGVKSRLVQVGDNNEVDKWVTKYRPATVIIEALWITPEKMELLTNLHPNVKWVVRLHSELPFIANEGIAMEWLKAYKNVTLASNSKYFISAMEGILGDIEYLPNYYPLSGKLHKHRSNNDTVHIGIFGAIRPLKNTLTQVVASINYAKSVNKKLYLHINTERIEQKGASVLKNIRALFKDSDNVLVEHGWLDHKVFLRLVSKMDLGLQVSLTETYNIVSADFISQNVPIVTSTEVSFVNRFSKVVSTKDVEEIIKVINVTLDNKVYLTRVNRILLLIDSLQSRKVWVESLHN